MDIMTTYRRWLNQTANEEELYRELLVLAEDVDAIEDRFYRELEFGTGGLRGVLGAGTNRMNIYTVGKATQGYSNYLLQNYSRPSVAIAYDSRIHSDLFAKRAACVFAANGIQVYLYDHLMPTPALSFAVRDLKCCGGIVITASHNPAKYNGYKVYGSDGCQITTKAAKAIQEEINAIDPFEDVRFVDFAEELASNTITYIKEDTISRYLAAVSTASVLPKVVDRGVSIVYTPLNGTGISCVPRCLREHGFTNVTIPTEQAEPDGNFPTCPYPNPEIRDALVIGLDWAKRTDSDLLLATDPDCDRVGAAVRVGQDYQLISGNEMGVLLLDFICQMRKTQGTMPTVPVAVKTIVTTPMAEKITAHYDVELINVLTGFKYIGEQIGLLEQEGESTRYIFGFEESYGYLSGSFVRDKDAVNASLLICEMFAWYRARGKTLVDVLHDLYDQYGYYETKLLTFTFEGKIGFDRMNELMNGLRKTPPAQIVNIPVENWLDYEQDGTGLPRANVLRFLLSEGEAVVRPSGTEPKLKVYLTSAKSSQKESREMIQTLEQYFTNWAK